MFIYATYILLEELFATESCGDQDPRSNKSLEIYENSVKSAFKGNDAGAKNRRLLEEERQIRPIAIWQGSQKHNLFTWPFVSLSPYYSFSPLGMGSTAFPEGKPPHTQKQGHARIGHVGTECKSHHIAWDTNT